MTGSCLSDDCHQPDEPPRYEWEGYPSSVCDHCPPHEFSPATREECALSWPFLCEGPRGRCLITETVDRNWTQLRIEHLHPAQQLAWTAFCWELHRNLSGLGPYDQRQLMGGAPERTWPFLCTPRRGHCFEFDARGFEHQ